MGEVERILRERAHVLRYWEQVIPQLSPRRSESGRRAYSETEILFFLRVKHLVRGRGLSPEAAREILLREAAGSRQDLLALAFEVRSLLVRAYFQSADALPPRDGKRIPRASER